MSATATESVPASSAGLEQPAQPVTASEPTEPPHTASLASEGHSTSSDSTTDGSDDATQFQAVSGDSTTPPPPPTS